MTKEIKTTSYPFPKVILDTDGYPTQEALNYLKNWYFFYQENGELLVGQFYEDWNFKPLIEYLKLIWYYSDAILYEDGLLELHTLGWSGNEDVIETLRRTTLWTFKHRATQTGGHYYFKIDSDTDWDWEVTKIHNENDDDTNL